MILSDRTLREQLEKGRIVIDPLDPSALQPSSVDLRLDGSFRVFRNHTMGHIDVKEDLSELTVLVEAAPDESFVLHPGEFVLGSTLERVACARRSRGAPRGEVESGAAGPVDPFDSGVR